MRKLISLCMALLLVFAVSGCNKDENLKQYEATIYFVNSAKTDIIPETRTISYSPSDILAQKVMEEFMKGPKGQESNPIIPKGTKLLSVEVNGSGMATCNFNTNIYSSVETDNLLIRTSVLRTLTSIPDIESVKILVNSGPYIDSNGLEIGIMRANDVVYDTDPEDKQHRDVTLYFADKDAQNLVAETRQVVLSPKESVEMRILKELIKGPEKLSLVKTIPEETRILSVETKEGVCFVNLSQEFITRHIGGSSSEMLTVYSIVNSLTQLENVDKVQFLIEGQKTEVYIQMIFNEPFTQNESIIG